MGVMCLLSLSLCVFVCEDENMRRGTTSTLTMTVVGWVEDTRRRDGRTHAGGFGLCARCWLLLLLYIIDCMLLYDAFCISYDTGFSTRMADDCHVV